LYYIILGLVNAGRVEVTIDTGRKCWPKFVIFLVADERQTETEFDISMEVVKLKNRIRTQTVKMTPEGGVDTAPKREMHVQFDGMNTGERDDSNSPYTSTSAAGRRYDNSRQICIRRALCQMTAAAAAARSVVLATATYILFD
jgi:hypothetical protein